MIRKHFLIGLLLVVVMLAALGCSSSSQPPANDTKQQEKQEQTSEAGKEQQGGAKEALPSVLNIGTHPSGSKFNALGSGLATVLSRVTPMEVKAVATSGPGEWSPMFQTHEMDLGVANNFDSQTSYLGKDVFEQISGGKGFPVRLLVVGSLNIDSTVVAEDSGIKTAQDLKGKRYVGDTTGSGGVSALARAFLANHNLSKNDVKWMSVPGVADGVRAIIEGRADANQAVLGMPIVQELEAAKGARYLGIDPSPEAMARLQEEYPAYAYKVEPGEGNVGVREQIYMMAYDNYFVARADLPDETAYTIVKALWENYKELEPIHADFKQWNPEKFVSEEAIVPYHPGAIKFFKEQGVWTDKMEDLQNKLLAQKQN